MVKIKRTSQGWDFEDLKNQLEEQIDSVRMLERVWSQVLFDVHPTVAQTKVLQQIFTHRRRQIIAQQAVGTNKAKYGDDYYQKIGARGGAGGIDGGFASEKKGVDGLTGRQRAKKAGQKGGKISKRPPYWKQYNKSGLRPG